MAVSCFTNERRSQTAGESASPAGFFCAHAWVASIAYIYLFYLYSVRVKMSKREELLCCKSLLANLVKPEPDNWTELPFCFTLTWNCRLVKLSLGKVISQNWHYNM